MHSKRGATPLHFPTSYPCIPVANTMRCSAVVSCEGELILLRGLEFYVVTYMVTAVYKPDSRIIICWPPNKWWPMGRDTSCMFYLQASPQDNEPPPTLSPPKLFLWQSISICIKHNRRGLPMMWPVAKTRVCKPTHSCFTITSEQETPLTNWLWMLYEK